MIIMIIVDSMLQLFFSNVENVGEKKKRNFYMISNQVNYLSKQTVN